MTYQQTIDYLYAQLPMFSRIGAAAYKEDLHNTIALCNSINNPQQHFKTIHIAGTNGKGSTSHMLAAVLQKAGYKTGLYTSPHLKDFRERIRIDGQMIPETNVTAFVQQTLEITAAIKPSFFELTVAMAFDYFAKEKVDIAVIETGLGGRLDSTNIITPLLSIITNIGYDHMDLLGNTLDKIAFEKAGIIKPNVPVVIGEEHPESKPVFISKAASVNAPISFAQHAVRVKPVQYSLQSLQCLATYTGTNVQESYQLDLNGSYQANNLATVLCAVQQLKSLGFQLPYPIVTAALSSVKQLTGLHGRWDVIATEPTIVLDVAHNEDGIKQVLKQLDQWSGAYEALHIIIGMVKDKDVNKVLRQLPTTAHYYFTQARIPRALPASELQEKAAVLELHGDIFPDVNTALTAAKLQANENDLVLVCGSVFLVGEVNV